MLGEGEYKLASPTRTAGGQRAIILASPLPDKSDRPTIPLSTARFDIDESCLVTGVAVMYETVLAALEELK